MTDCLAVYKDKEPNQVEQRFEFELLLHDNYIFITQRVSPFEKLTFCQANLSKTPDQIACIYIGHHTETIFCFTSSRKYSRSMHNLQEHFDGMLLTIPSLAVLAVNVVVMYPSKWHLTVESFALDGRHSMYTDFLRVDIGKHQNLA